MCLCWSNEDIKEGNEPLNHPSTHTTKRKEILDRWSRNLDWKDVDKYWRENDYKLVYKVWSVIPAKAQHLIREILGKR